MSQVIRAARAVMRSNGIDDPQSDCTFRRWLEWFRKNYYPEWVLFREGEKALNDKCLPHIQRDMSRIEVGDVLVADGHILNWQIWNPWTGKPSRMTLIAWYDMKSNYLLGWEIMPSENVQAISMALYRAILVLGKLPKIAYTDNGKAFRAKYFSNIADFSSCEFAGIFQQLGIHTVFAWPYHAESKPVEGFFRAFGELERWSPTYTGTSIEDKPARLKRNERLHRAMHSRLTGDHIPTIEESHIAIASWLDSYHERPQKTGNLDGACPREVFEAGKGPGFSDEERMRLTILMMRQSSKKVYRDGIRHRGFFYYHPSLYGLQQQSVMVRYDSRDDSRIWVFGEDNAFICEAEVQRKIHPMARLMGTSEDVQALQEAIELKRRLAKETAGPALRFLSEHVMPDVRKQMRSIGFDGGKNGDLKAIPAAEDIVDVQLTKEELDETERRLQELIELNAKDVVPAESEPEHIPEIVRPRSIWERLPEMQDSDRYEWHQKMEAQGKDLPASELEWASWYRRTDEYKRLEDYFEEHRIKMALLYREGLVDESEWANQ